MSKPNVRRSSIEPLECRALMTAVTVTTLADSGTGSLRAAIASAASGDTISFGSLQGTVTLASTLDLSGKNLTIAGSGRSRLTIDGSATAQAVKADGLSESVTIHDLTIVGGHAGTANGAAFEMDGGSGLANLVMTNVDVTGGKGAENGGGLSLHEANLTLTNCNLFGNAERGNNGYGGAVAINFGTMTATDSSFYNNSATGLADTKAAGGGAVYVHNGVLLMTNCTVANNTVMKVAQSTSPSDAGAFGGGVALENSHGQILQSTIAYNTVIAGTNSAGTNAGGGLYIDADSTTYVQSSLVAGNAAPASKDMYLASGSILAGFDVIGDGTGSGATNGQYSSQVGTLAAPIDAKIGQLASNGGNVKTIALLAGSPAIDAAYFDTPRADARGVSRGSTPDVGAYEYVAPVVPEFDGKPRARIATSGTSGTLDGDATISDSSALSYAWKLTGKPAHAGDPTIGNAAAATTPVTFRKAGTYTFRVTVTAANGEVTSRKVTSVVGQVATAMHIVQHQRTLSSVNATRLRAFVSDQFGNVLADQPSITWALLEGAGSIDASTGLYTPTDVHYSHLVFRATAGGVTGTAGNRLLKRAA